MSEDENQITPQNPHANESDDDNIEAMLPDEFLGNLPSEHQRRIGSTLGLSVGISGPIQDPISERITSEHITQVLDNRENAALRAHKAGRSERWLAAWFGTLILAAAVGLIVFFGIRETYEVVTAIIGGLLGFAGGFGVGRIRR